MRNRSGSSVKPSGGGAASPVLLHCPARLQRSQIAPLCCYSIPRSPPGCPALPATRTGRAETTTTLGACGAAPCRRQRPRHAWRCGREPAGPAGLPPPLAAAASRSLPPVASSREHLQAVIKSSDMSEEMQQEVVSISSQVGCGGGCGSTCRQVDRSTAAADADFSLHSRDRPSAAAGPGAVHHREGRGGAHQEGGGRQVGAHLALHRGPQLWCA